MNKAPHIMNKAPHIMNKAPHIMNKAPHIMNKAPHIITDGPHIITDGPRLITDGQHVMNKVPHVIKNGPHAYKVKCTPDNIKVTRCNDKLPLKTVLAFHIYATYCSACANLIFGELAEADLGNILSVYTIRCRI